MRATSFRPFRILGALASVSLLIAGIASPASAAEESDGDLIITKEVQTRSGETLDGFAEPWMVLTYSVTVEYNGDEDLEDVQFIETIPDGVEAPERVCVGAADKRANGSTSSYGCFRLGSSGSDSKIQLTSDNRLILILDVQANTPDTKHTRFYDFSVWVLPEAAGTLLQNSGTVTYQPSAGGPTETQSTGSTLVPVAPRAAIVNQSLTASLQTDDLPRAGDEILYTLSLSNRGNSDLEGVIPEFESFSGSGDTPAFSCVSPTLAALGSFECTARYQLTQSDIDAGSVQAEAITQGSVPESGEVMLEGDPSAETALTQQAEFDLELSPSVATVQTPGDPIEFTATITNSGNVTLSDVSVESTDFSGATELGALSCPDGELAPGASVTCAITYLVASEDLTGSPLELSVQARATGIDTDLTHDAHATVATIAPEPEPEPTVEPQDSSGHAPGTTTPAESHDTTPVQSGSDRPSATVTASTTESLATTGGASMNLVIPAISLALLGVGLLVRRRSLSANSSS